MVAFAWCSVMMAGVRKVWTATLLVVLGGAGTFSGVSLVSEPDGRSLGLDQGMLPPWHTWNYLVYGVFALTVLGMAPLVCAAAVIVDVGGTTAATGVLGTCVIGWVLGQILILGIDAPYAHTALSIIGALLLAGVLSTALHRRRLR